MIDDKVFFQLGKDFPVLGVGLEFFDECFDVLINNGDFNELPNRRPLRGIFDQQSVDQILEIIRIGALFYRWVLGLHNESVGLICGLSDEWKFEGAHLVGNNTDCPDVLLFEDFIFLFRFLENIFWGHVQGGPDNKAN